MPRDQRAQKLAKVVAAKTRQDACEAQLRLARGALARAVFEAVEAGVSRNQIARSIQSTPQRVADRYRAGQASKEG